ncbi:hypothetical protein CNMCM8980_005226 [Aspergillus fumigatiaffinis]|nr:hypothetical protein CNMCM8980_005226 [Aspergillus fumigatiaffinis]
MLYRARIPYKVWSHRDVLIAHGSAQDEGPRELHLLVNDVEKAAQALQEVGYLRTALSFLQGDLGIPESEMSKTCRLVSPTALEEGIARWQKQTSRDPAELLAEIRKGHEWHYVRGVALLAAESWAYEPIESGDEEPIPELHEYFNSLVSLWLAGSSKKRVQDMYVQGVIVMIVTELDEAWSVGFEKGVRVVYRPILFDLMRQTHEELAYHTRAWGVWTLLLFYEEFRDYHRSRVQKEMNLHDLPCPVWSHGFVRERPRLTIERTVEKSRDTEYYSANSLTMAGEKAGSKTGKAIQKVKSALNLKQRFSKKNLRDEGQRQKTQTQERNDRTRQCKCLGTRPGDPPNIGLENMTNEELREVLNEAGRALTYGRVDYGFIGGAALYTYGQLRMTKDVDILVPNGQVQHARQTLRQNSGGRFNWDPAYSRTHMCPQQLDLPQDFLETPNGARVAYHARRLVHLRGIMQMKRIAHQARASAKDAEDIAWLEGHMGDLEREIAEQRPRDPVEWDAARQGPRP